MLEAAQWYLKREDPVSARAMLRRLHRLHPQSAAGGVALDILMQRGWLETAASAAAPSTIEPAIQPTPTPPAAPAPTEANP